MASRTALNLTEVEREELTALVRASRTPRALADRCKAVLLDDQGLTYAAIGAKIGMREQTVLKWRNRFLADRLAGLRDKPRPGVKRKITDEQVAEVVRMTLEEKPPDATHWSLRSMAAASGISRSSVNTIWRAFNLQPHRTETFKLSRDPNFVEKVRDIVGLYMSPPENAVVLCVDGRADQATDHPAAAASTRPTRRPPRHITCSRPWRSRPGWSSASATAGTATEIHQVLATIDEVVRPPTQGHERAHRAGQLRRTRPP